MKLKTVVFPSISTSIYGFPIDKASRISVNTVKEYLGKSNLFKEVFGLLAMMNMKSMLKQLKKYIDEA